MKVTIHNFGRVIPKVWESPDLLLAETLNGEIIELHPSELYRVDPTKTWEKEFWSHEIEENETVRVLGCLFEKEPTEEWVCLGTITNRIYTVRWWSLYSIGDWKPMPEFGTSRYNELAEKLNKFTRTLQTPRYNEYIKSRTR